MYANSILSEKMETFKNNTIRCFRTSYNLRTFTEQSDQLCLDKMLLFNLIIHKSDPWFVPKYHQNYQSLFTYVKKMPCVPYSSEDHANHFKSYQTEFQ